MSYSARSLLTLVFCLTAAVHSAAAEPVLDDYRRLTEWRFLSQPIPVPEGGLGWDNGTASWRLESGRIWLQEPIAGGVVTGLVFEGRGRFRMTVPDPFELAQLRRFSAREDLAAIDEGFSRLVLRAAPGLPFDLEVPKGAAFAPHKLARERHDHWLTDRFHDVDARVLAALHTPGDRCLLADMDTASFGWLSYEQDAARQEEIHLETFKHAAGFLESWLSLAEERDARGRPQAGWRPAFDVRHVDITADLTRPGRDSFETAAELRATVHFTPAQPGARALRFWLDPMAEVSSVTDEEGRALPFLRHHVGSRSAVLDKRLYDRSLVVFLPEPLTEGERRLTFNYRMDLVNYAQGRAWYPEAASEGVGLLDRHTARLELTVPKKNALRAMGERLEEREDGKLVTSVWVVEEPVKMVTFSFAERFHEQSLKVETVPEVICFGPKAGASTKSKYWNVGADVANSINYFQQLFDDPLTVERIHATSIDAYHGQAFEGFLHLSSLSFEAEHPGATELFRAHEVAHQWWGHRVGWQSYRDQWLSEAFAEYSAMLFVEATVKGGPKYFQEILRVYTDTLNGSLKTALSKFARPWAVELNPKHAARMGPIGHGYRAGTAQVQRAYFTQTYIKGALVLHMLRSLMRSVTKSDEIFIAVLRDYIATHGGGSPTTEDFKAVVAKHAPDDWSWFFDQWVYSSAIPTYTWSYRIADKAGGGFELTVDVTQSGVPEGFRMPVPLRLELADGRSAEMLIKVDQPQRSVTVPLAVKPERVVFNPGHAVLAKVKKR